MVTQGRLQRKESTYSVAKLAFHAKESPIRDTCAGERAVCVGEKQRADRHAVSESSL